MRYSIIWVSILVWDLSVSRGISQDKNLLNKPNIVLIITDDQGWGDLSFYGNANLQTPNIDAIAKNGASFENFYVQPVCSPTRAELLTGRHSAKLGVYSTSAGGERINLDETTIGEIFKIAGYRTAAYGKWHSGMQPPYHPNTRGFDDFYGFASGHWGNYFNPMLERNGKVVQGEGYIIDNFTNKAIEFISNTSDKPFFLYLPYNTPHSPMQVPDKYWNRFKNKDLAMHYHGKEEEDVDFTKAALAMVENIDDNIGRIMATLTQADKLENTIVVFLSDNGPNGWRWNGDMKGRKGHTDEGGVRSPLFIQWDRIIPDGVKVSQIASAMDILPTLVDLATIDCITKQPLDGRSLKPLLTQKEAEWEPRLIFNHWKGSTSVRSQDFRLDRDEKLYNIAVDREQTKDISKSNTKQWKELKEAKRKWLEDIDNRSSSNDTRPFTLGHPGSIYTQLPARDGKAHGHIERSNRFPNCSFFTNWQDTSDYISWDVEVLEEGVFEVDVYYACPKKSVGTVLQLGFLSNSAEAVIHHWHDPPLKGKEHDRTPRGESYVKDFVPLSLGEMRLNKGIGTLTLGVQQADGEPAVDIRMIMFKKLTDTN